MTDDNKTDTSITMCATSTYDTGNTVDDNKSNAPADISTSNNSDKQQDNTDTSKKGKPINNTDTNATTSKSTDNNNKTTTATLTTTTIDTKSVGSSNSPLSTSSTQPIVSLSEAALSLGTLPSTTTNTLSSTTSQHNLQRVNMSPPPPSATPSTAIYYAQPMSLPTHRYSLRHSNSNNSLSSHTSDHVNKFNALTSVAKSQIDSTNLNTQQPTTTLQSTVIQPTVVEPVEENIIVDDDNVDNVDAGNSIVVLDEVIRQEVVRCICGKTHIEPLLDNAKTNTSSNDTSSINTTTTTPTAVNPNSNLADPTQPVTNDNVSEAVIQCESCMVWQHARCVGLTSVDSIPEQYYCDLCDPDSTIHQTRIKYEQLMSKLSANSSPAKTNRIKKEFGSGSDNKSVDENIDNNANNNNANNNNKLTPSKRLSNDLKDAADINNNNNNNKHVKTEATTDVDSNNIDSKSQITSSTPTTDNSNKT